MIYALLMLADAPAEPAIPLDLLLACEGSSMVGGGILDYGPRTQRSYTVQVRVLGESVSLLFPSTGGIVEDWRTSDNVLIDDDQITGKVRTSIFGKSSFKIDRRSGIMTSQGGFSGSCRKVEGQAF